MEARISRHVLSSREHLRELGQATPDRRHTHPAHAATGRRLKPNVRLHQFTGALFEGKHSAFGALRATAAGAAGKGKGGGGVDFGAVGRTLREQDRAFSREHVHRRGACKDVLSSVSAEGGVIDVQSLPICHRYGGAGSVAAVRAARQRDACRTVPLIPRAAPHTTQVHQGCLGNCYFAAALSLLARFGREALYGCIQEHARDEERGTGRCFTVTFKHVRGSQRVKRGRAIKCRDVRVRVDDWFWVSADDGASGCPSGGTHNEPNAPLFMKTANCKLHGAIWPMVMEKAYACAPLRPWQQPAFAPAPAPGSLSRRRYKMLAAAATVLMLLSTATKCLLLLPLC